MVVDTRSVARGATHRGRCGVVAPPASVKTVPPKFFRRASLTTWGKDNLGMTRAAADINIKELMLTVQQQKYEDKDKAAQRDIFHKESCADAKSIRQRNERRARLLSRSSARRNFLVGWEMEGRANWNKNQAALCRYERRLLSYELAVRERVTALRRLSRARHADDACHGIQWYETNLENLGLDPGGDVGGNAGAGSVALPPEDVSQATFRSKIFGAGIDQNFMPGNNAEAMAELRFRGNAGRRARHEREQRRLKTEVDQRHAKAATDGQRAADEHLGSMLTVGRERRAAAAAHWERLWVRKEEAVKETKRFAKLTAARQSAFEKAFNERTVNARERFAASEAERDAAAKSRRDRLWLHRDEKRARAESLCVSVVLKMVDLAVVASETRASIGGVPLPPKVWTRLKLCFCSTDQFFKVSVTPERPTEPRNPSGEANALLQRRNLDRCEGRWRPCRLTPAAFTKETALVEAALSLARNLVDSPMTGPREPPCQYEDNGIVLDGANTNSRDLSVRLVLLGGKNMVNRVRGELESWTGLYCCELETALECAMDLGTTMAAVDSTNAGGRKTRKSSVAARKSIVALLDGSAPSKGEEGIDGATGSMTANESSRTGEFVPIATRAFGCDAAEDDIAAFKEVAAAYYALRTNPKKARTPVPLSTTTEVLTTHLACRSKKGRGGWILVGYPRSLIEAKMLENALTGYVDNDVLAELASGSKSAKVDAKKKKVSVVSPKEVPQLTPTRSGLDAVVCLARAPSRAPSKGLGTRGQPKVGPEDKDLDGMQVGPDDESDELKKDESLAAGTETAQGAQATPVENTGKRQKDHDETNISGKDHGASAEWWSTFEGGQLACELPHEASDERLLETLFLLAVLAQKRKEEHEVWVHEHKRGQYTFAEGDATAGVDCRDPVNIIGGIPAVHISKDSRMLSSLCRVSPLAYPLMNSVKAIRNRRRRAMSHATRIRVEALTGERDLDLEGVRAAIVSAAKLHTSVTRNTEDDGRSVSSERKELQKLEEECTASFPVDWIRAAEFSFARRLRAPDERWTAACLSLEDEIANFVTLGNAAAANDSHARTSNNNNFNNTSTCRGVSGCEYDDEISPRAERDRVWMALELFELDAGDIVDDRHATMDAACREIDIEAKRQVSAWARTASKAAADLCAAEWDGHRGTTEILRSLDALFGLELEVGSAGITAAKAAARTAADGVVSEMSVPIMSSEVNLFGDGCCQELEEKIRLACEYVKDGSSPDDINSVGGSRPVESIGNNSRLGTAISLLADGAYTHECNVDEKKKLPDQPAKDGQSLFGGSGEEDNDMKHRDANEVAEGDALATALWKSKYHYVCRIWAVVTRLAKAVKRCESLTSSVGARMKAMKRRRVQLEHDGVIAAAAAVRRALTEFDKSAITEILQHGIPFRVEDRETFAADPGVALSWGMNSLGLAHIASLAVTLRQNFEATATSRTDRSNAVDVAVPSTTDLADIVRTWAEDAAEVAQQGGFAPGEREEIPHAWINGGISGYIATLCTTVHRGICGREVARRRLLHCLLLGHIHALPTLNELRAMRYAFERQQHASPSEVQGVPKGPLAASPGSATISQGGTATASENMQSILTLRIAQKCFVDSVRLWFEEETNSSTTTEKVGGHEKGDEGRKGRGISSTIKAVYSEAWSEDDCRLDVLDLLLTLCAEPTGEGDEESTVVGGEDSHGGDSGIPFSLGLFRAFTLLADTPPSATAGSGQSDSREHTTAIPATAIDTDGTRSITSKPTRNGEGPRCLECDSNPYVTLPQLHAILQYGREMSSDIVSDVFEAAWKIDEDERAKVRRQRAVLLEDAHKGSLLNGEKMCHASAVGKEQRGDTVTMTAEEENGQHNDGRGHTDGGEGLRATEGGGPQSGPTLEAQLESVPNGQATALGSMGVPNPEAANTDVTGSEAEELGPGIVDDGQDDGQRPSCSPKDIIKDGSLSVATTSQAPRKVSFAAVSECDAVRLWIRRGAYMLPSFEVTSGSSFLL